ncbi:MAG: hypothetical protein QNJ94_11130 [Alphaproteobacteria bacterium]|nr:hypothetical protein [Alphaproteobacteria bacterium]
MIQSLGGKPPAENGFFGGGQSDLKVGLAILIGVVAISALVAVCAAAGAFGIGPRMEPVAYLFIEISAVMLLVSFLITFVRDQIRAGLYLAAFWALAMMGVFAVFKYAG